jgi:hypothetical protein
MHALQLAATVAVSAAAGHWLCIIPGYWVRKQIAHIM